MRHKKKATGCWHQFSFLIHTGAGGVNNMLPMILDVTDIGNFGINDYLGKEFECKCGKKHRVAIDKVVIGKGALQQIPGILHEYQYRKIFLAADQHTYRAAGEQVEKLLQDSGFVTKSLVYRRPGDLVPDETAIGEYLVNVAPDTEMIVAVGSGVINDLSKYISYRLGIPFMIVATAPSMDGFTSDNAALILENLKTSPDALPARAIIGDVDVLKAAPLEMIGAGLGDMLGKYSSLKDWKMSRLLFGEYYCETVAAMVKYSVQKCRDNLAGLKNRDEAAIRSLMEGLIISGIAMSFVGNSRPASGSEHHISHYWEMAFLQLGKSAVLHGIKVGIAALAANQIGRFLAAQKIDFDRAVQNAAHFDEAKWEFEIKRLFQKAAPGILKQSRENNRNSVVERVKRVEAIRQNWPQVAAVLQEEPVTAEIKNLLAAVGAPVNPKEIGVAGDIIYNSIIYAREIRSRYTVLQLAWDLGLIEPAAAAIKDYYEGLQDRE
jgi:glycerol-1-phosphate dehydrogenase [NAD(P)+]